MALRYGCLEHEIEDRPRSHEGSIGQGLSSVKSSAVILARDCFSLVDTTACTKYNVHKMNGCHRY